MLPGTYMNNLHHRQTSSHSTWFRLETWMTLERAPFLQGTPSTSGWRNRQYWTLTICRTSSTRHINSLFCKKTTSFSRGEYLARSSCEAVYPEFNDMLCLVKTFLIYFSLNKSISINDCFFRTLAIALFSTKLNFIPLMVNINSNVLNNSLCSSHCVPMWVCLQLSTTRLVLPHHARGQNHLIKHEFLTTTRVCHSWLPQDNSCMYPHFQISFCYTNL